jgi:tRNA pseudouridine55 synthase
VESNKVTFQITVSKGTYIRSIVEELGKSLNTVAIVEKLTRTSIGNLDMNHSKLNKNIEIMDYKSNLQSLHWKEVINLPILEINQEVLKSVQHGQLILSSMFSNQEKYILSINNDAVAIYKPFNEKYFKPDKVLL